MTAERLWDALYLARVGESARRLADLEDAVFRYYLPLARTLPACDIRAGRAELMRIHPRRLSRAETADNLVPTSAPAA